MQSPEPPALRPASAPPAADRPADAAAVRRPRIVLAPMNFANMPMQIVQALQRRGYAATHVQYSGGQGHKFGYGLDREVNVRSFDSRMAAHGATLRELIEADFDIFHFWNKSLFFNTDYTSLTGLDLPLLKARQKKIIHRFSGFDLRLRRWDLERNPYSPFRYGYEFPADERLQLGFIALLRDYADRLLVQDPELGQFLPEARIIPRALDLRDWSFVGVAATDRPLVIHTPTNPEVKGTAFVLKAVEALRDEGLAFDFQLVQDVSHDEARAWMRKADIVVDQLLIGATGVVTLEAWALGKPVVLYLREDLFRPFYGTADLPVANANPDTVESVLRRLIKDADWRRQLALAGRRTVEAHHDIDRVIEQFIELYEAVHLAPARPPAGPADIDYLVLQAEAAAATGRALHKVEDVLRESRLLGADWQPGSWTINVDLQARLRQLKLEVRRQVQQLRRGAAAAARPARPVAAPRPPRPPRPVRPAKPARPPGRHRRGWRGIRKRLKQLLASLLGRGRA